MELNNLNNTLRPEKYRNINKLISFPVLSGTYITKKNVRFSFKNLSD